MRNVDLIVPCYNEEEMVELFYQTTSKIVSEIEGYNFNFIFIDDGSKDKTLQKMRKLSSKFKNVKYISFSRNFGKESAMYAGLKASTGDRVAVIDADLQHPPELIKDMLFAIDQEGYDSCSGRRVSRDGEPKIRSAFSRLFYRIINKMSDIELIDGAVDYRMMSRQMVDAILSMPEVQRFSKGIFAWVGFNTKWIEFKNVERVAGTTTWSFTSLFKYAIEGIVAFTTFPLRILSMLGLCVSASSFIYLIIEFIRKLVLGEEVISGYSSTIIILLFIGGIIILSLGIIGEYMARMYMETKRRPIFIAREQDLKNDNKE